ncbi:hypothetical protein LIA77_07250 [Sarocladium implicatum]|nr:hypothetical protein LIA77_07250 [Sarocladium implicatum]
MAPEQKDMELIHASMARMGTMSMAEAYKMLGYNPHHYFISPSKDSAWNLFERAVDGKYPQVAGAKPGRKLYTRQDWDVARGKYDFFTDFYAHHTPDLIRAYPEAKVVVVQRDFESWYESYKIFCLDLLIRPSWIPIRYIFNLPGIPAFDATEREKLGFFGVKHISEITTELAREKYDDFFADVRALVPTERRLEYKLGDGWEPLCKFLGKPVPDVPFPRANERKVMADKQDKGLRIVYMGMGAVLVGIGAAGWYAVSYALGQ